MVQDSADRERVGDVGNDLERATAAFADERIRLKDLGDEPRPAWGAAALLGPLLILLASQFLGRPLAAYAVGVAGRGRLPTEITSLPQGAAAPGRGRPFEAVLELQFLEGDATAGLVTSSPPSTATRSAWTRASGTRRRIAIATARS